MIVTKSPKKIWTIHRGVSLYRRKGKIITALAASTFLTAISVSSASAQALNDSVTGSAVATAPTVATPSNDIIVTAQRVATRLERTPIAISVLTAEALERQVITTQSDLQISVPGLLVRQTGSSNNLNYSLRGQSAALGAGSFPAVAVYLNEVPADEGDNSASALFDLQSVQVLKGPQGTLFGRNSTGGAVIYTTTQPGEEFGGYIRARAGEYDLRAIEGAIDVPIAKDLLLLRLAGYHEESDGYFFNLFDGSDLGAVNRDSVRATAKFMPSSTVTSTLFIEYSTSGGTNSPSITSNLYRPGQTNNGIPLKSSLYSLYDPATVDALFGPGAWASYLALHPKSDPLGIANAVEVQSHRSPYIVNSNADYTHWGRSVRVSNISSWDIIDNLQLKNIFGYSHVRNRDGFGYGATPFPSGASTESDRETYSEELQLIGKLLENRLTYVAGFYFLDTTLDATAGVGTPDLLPFLPPAAVTFIARTKTRSYSGYAQGTYDLSDTLGAEGLSITAGVRYTDESVDNYALPGSAVFNVPGFSNKLSTGTEKISYQFGVQQQVNPELMIYGTTRRSFRGGGFNGGAPRIPGDASQGGALFRPEVATDYEAGAKYKGRFGGTSVSVNLAAYTMTVKNVQRLLYVDVGAAAPVTSTINVPEARVRGIELDGQIAPSDWLHLGGSINYTDAEFTKPATTLFGVTTVYGPYPDAPEWTGSFYAEVGVPLGADVGNLAIRGDVFATSRSYYSSLANTLEPNTVLPGYAVANFRVALENIASQQLTVAAVLKNAFNKQYYVGGISSASFDGSSGITAAAPRVFSVEAIYKF